MKDIYMIGNTHFDPVWLWRWDEAMASIHSTFRSALDRMEEDADFVYSFATPPVFEWIKETDPDMFEQIKERVREGRWELPEGWWLQPDCFSACGESYARQALYGQKYLLENFGKYSDTVFNIDSFGHTSQTPQMLCKSGMKNYVLCRPEDYHFPIAAPYFKWVGKDGSEIKAFRAGQYSRVYNKNMTNAVAVAEAAMENAPCDEMMVYGVTNHGGAPTKKAIADIHALDAQKDYNLRFSTVSGYFDAQGEPYVTVRGELITGDFGVYANNVQMKRKNRVAEYSVLNAEKSAILAQRLLAREYPKDKLDGIWKDIMFNQFHDILGGASIKEAYIDAYDQLGRATTSANEITKFALTAITHKIKMPGKNPDNPWNLTIWNLNSAPFDGYIEAELQWLHEFPAYEGGIVLEDAEGNRYPTQKLLEGSVIQGFRSKVLFKASIGGLGYKTFKVIQTNIPDRISDYSSKTTLTAGGFELVLDEQTGFIKTLEKMASGQVWNEPVIPVVLEDKGDTWCFNVSGYGESLGEFTLDEVLVTESGIHRTTLRTIHSFKDSKLTLYYTFYEDHFDISYRVNWNEKHAVLKLILDYGYDKLLVSSPFASETRADGERDKPMGEWIYSHSDNGGMLVLCDSAFAYNKMGSKLAITLLRSCIYGDLRTCELDPGADYPYMQQGITEGSVRMVPVELTDKPNFADLGAQFNNAPIVICDANHDGMLAPSDSFADIDCESACVSAIKRGYSDCSEVIRLYEFLGQEQSAEMNYFGIKLKLQLSPYEIKTVKISKGVITETDLLEE